MTLTISAVSAWDFATVAAQLDNLRADQPVFEESAAEIEQKVASTLGGFECYTVSVSTDSCDALVRKVRDIGQKLERLIAALDTFCATAPDLRRKLLKDRAEAIEARCRVEDDGTVRPPLIIGEPTDPEVIQAHEEGAATATRFQDRIMPTLDELKALDFEAANVLCDISGEKPYVFYPYDPDKASIDPRTLAATTTVSTSTGATKTAAMALDASSTVLRGFPIFGNVLNLGIGLATSPEQESVVETLAIEGGGIAAAAGSAAVAGATAGSVVPGWGTAAGFVGGLIGGVASTTVLRDYVNEKRADGKEGYW